MNSSSKYSNALINETSPYLLQHAQNPVNWLPYSEVAFEQAQKHNKLILFSIGYSACHWCHVMEHESFENEAIAKIMNQHFICVKVDREERPDVDQIYMNAVQLITGSGGWPLNCFALPDGSPVWGGTYFRPKDWENILNSLAHGYTSNPVKYIQAAEQIKQGIAQTEMVIQKKEIEAFSKAEIDEKIIHLITQFDTNYGGFIGQPKFPLPGLWKMLLNFGLKKQRKDIVEHVLFTLKKMAYGGIYDQIEGGFARYSVDNRWHVPHFEKMLYDNAQLIELFALAYRVENEPVFLRVIEQTKKWLHKDLKTEDHLFQSAIDADSQGTEGLYYLWSEEELMKMPGDSWKEVKSYFNIAADQIFEKRYILQVPSMDEPTLAIQSVIVELLKERQTRIKPETDSKVICSWNAQLLNALCESYKANPDLKIRSMALFLGKAMIENFVNNNGELLRINHPKKQINGYLDDYAFTIQALINLYEISLDDSWLEQALKLTETTIALFFDTESHMFFYTDKNTKIIIRKMELSDNVIPSSNAVMASNLKTLSILTENPYWASFYKQMLANIYNDAMNNVYFHYEWVNLLLSEVSNSEELVVIGKQAEEFLKNIYKQYRPYLKIIASTEKNDDLPLLKNRYKAEQTLIYHCINNACSLPVESFEEWGVKYK
ncbi:MAG: thioredoxin domain-containing protein [Bacteroidales bacterium]|nr:thioredoxin domain-containing protein [Bacteroidales bacterium]